MRGQKSSVCGEKRGMNEIVAGDVGRMGVKTAWGEVESGEKANPA